MFRGLEKYSRIAVAVSGGPDSLALCCLLRDWRNSLDKANRPSFVPIHVDHGLRPESEIEACRLLSMFKEHHVLGELETPEVVKIEWEGALPSPSKIQTKAREKRFQSIERICSRENISALVLGQHLDDNIETFLNRLFRSSGLKGLSCMKPVSSLYYTDTESRKCNIVSLYRPLLKLRKHELQLICKRNRLDPIQDPSNKNLLFDRVRARTFMAENENTLHPKEMSLLMDSISNTWNSVSERLDKKIDPYFVSMPNACISFVSMKVFSKATDLEACLLLQEVISRALGPLRNAYPARQSSLLALWNRMQKEPKNKFNNIGTLSGLLFKMFQSKEGCTLVVSREKDTYNLPKVTSVEEIIEKDGILLGSEMKLQIQADTALKGVCVVRESNLDDWSNISSEHVERGILKHFSLPIVEFTDGSVYSPHFPGAPSFVASTSPFSLSSIIPPNSPQ